MQTVFSFRAAAPDGRVTRGVVDADSSDIARGVLSARGLYVLTLEQRGTRRALREPMSAADLALGLRILADLLDSGLPVTRALVAFEELAPRGWRNAVPAIRQSVREGHGLAAAFATSPVAIPALVVGIAQAGEAGAGIGPAIRRAADLMEATAETQASVRSALAYPVVVAVAGAGAIGVLITVVLPRFAKILADLGQTLPTSTRIVLDVATIARAALVPAVISAVTIAVAWRAWTQTENGRRQWHRMLLATPVVGRIRRAAAIARVAHSLAALLDTGVTIAAALTHASRAAGDAELEFRLLSARADVASGQPLSRALEAAHAATPTTVRLTRAGEESGRLPAMLAHAARMEQQRADRFVKTGVRMLEPVLLLTFASIVALVAAALLQAIYSVRPTA